MNGLTFQEEGHIYRLDGQIVPSVTEILRHEGFVNLDHVQPEVLEKAANYGTNAHRYCEYRDKGILDESSLSETAKGILDVWEGLKSKYSIRVVKIEESMASRMWRYACTLDRIAEIEGKLCLAEIKTTSGIGRHVRLQLAGQQVCAEEQGFAIVNRWVFDFTHEGVIGVECYKASEYQKDKSVFLSAVNTYRWKTGR